jgi:hypothetical protein
MIEINEWDITTVFDSGFICQCIKVKDIGTYYADPAKTVEGASINRKNLLDYIYNDLKSKHEVKINLYYESKITQRTN